MPVGKNILENLTIAMYENSLTIFREYIQNSADSIDKACKNNIIDKNYASIDIHVDCKKRMITIYDNAFGIQSAEFKKEMLVVADSSKDRDIQKGFRGIGRLAGLGYCNKLTFSTSAYGESTKSIIEWDGKKLKEIVNDKNQHPTFDDLINDITNIYFEKEDTDEHYFLVEMSDIPEECNEILDIEKIKEYLSSVAPVPYQPYFIYGEKIKKFAEENNFKIDEYNVSLNGEKINKLYHCKLYEGTPERKNEYDELADIEFKIFKKNEESIAWLWYGVSKFEKCIPVINKMRCIRLRKENIQIGDENTISYSKGFFKETRGNRYFLGELFVLDKNLIPNARRDYFNPSSELQEFEHLVHNFFYTELYDLYYFASKVRSQQKFITKLEQKKEEFNDKLNNKGFIDEEEETNAKKNLDDDEEKIKENKNKLEKLKIKSESSRAQNIVFQEITKNEDDKSEKKENKKNIDKKNVKDISKGNNVVKDENKYMVEDLEEYGKEGKKIIKKIYKIIKTLLPSDEADELIRKIQKKLCNDEKNSSC